MSFQEGDDSASLDRGTHYGMCGFFGPRVRDNADAIIEAQVKEIEQIELLLEDIEANVEMVEMRH